MAEETRLTPEAILLIREEIGKTVTKWAKIIGISSLIFLFSSAIYIFFVLPGQAANRVIAMQLNIQKKIQETSDTVLINAGAVQGHVNVVRTEITDLSVELKAIKERIEDINKSLTAFNKDKAFKALQIVEKFGKSHLAELSNLIPIIQAGIKTNSISNKDNEKWTLSTGTGEREFIGVIKFKPAFATPPKVVIGLTGFEFKPTAKRIRVVVKKEDIDVDKFKYKIETRGDVSILGVRFSWLAIGRTKR